MKKNSAPTFLEELQTHALQQSKLQNTSVFPSFFTPITAFIGEKPWQSLTLSSFLVAWIVLLLQFEFFFNFVQNIL